MVSAGSKAAAVAARAVVWAAAIWALGASVAYAAPVFCPAAAGTPARQAVGDDGHVDARRLSGVTDVKAFAPSPNGRLFVALVQTPDAAGNSYDAKWLLGRTDCAGAAFQLDDGGRPISSRAYGRPQGFIDFQPVRWSPDGRWIAYRKQVGEQIQLWVADIQERSARRASTTAADVDDFGWTDDGVLVFRTGLDLELSRRLIAAEARTGLLYRPERFRPSSGILRPMHPDCGVQPASAACDRRVFAFEPGRPTAEGARLATKDEEARSLAKPQLPKELMADGSRRSVAFVARGNAANLAWAQNADPKVYVGSSPLRRMAAFFSGRSVTCTHPACAGEIVGVWWSADRAVIFQRLESSVGREDQSPFDVTSLYRWEPRTGGVRRLHSTEDALDRCAVAASDVFCLLETSRRPARVVKFPAGGGRAVALLDPNPDWPDLAGLRIEKAHYVSDTGFAGYYYVVFPRGYQAGRSYPTVVVQYQARGFLRGGTGNEYPIFPLAEQGFVVIAFQKTGDPGQRKTNQEIARNRLSRDLPERRAWTRAVEDAVDRLIARGVADPTRVALTGLSAGSEMLHYALQRTDRFATAIASQGAIERDFLAMTPPLYTDFKRMYHADKVFEPEGVLQELAWSNKPEKLRTPLLVNVVESEFLHGLEGFSALCDAGRPIEVRVFPDTGGHIKYDPANRLAVYELDLQWLAYWLGVGGQRDPALADQYARWDRMRAQLEAERRTASEAGERRVASR